MITATASVSLDLDNQWAYMKTQGVPGWEGFHSYFDVVVPRILDTVKRAGVRLTCFVVGKDAALACNQMALKSIADAGHEIANHSFMHEPWLHLYTEQQLRADFDQAEAAILHATGQKPLGFRGPGFSTSRQVRALLRDRGYIYDASKFPTWLGPVARTYFFLTSNLPAEEKARRRRLYGSLADARSPLQPYQIEPGLMEIPVTTLPLLRTPIHLSYLLFLARFSTPLARWYWDLALALCRMRGVAPSLLLHPTDFMDVGDAPAMAFFPAMQIPAERKIALVRHTLSTLRQRWNVVPHLDLCRSIQGAVPQVPEVASAPGRAVVNV